MYLKWFVYGDACLQPDEDGNQMLSKDEIYAALKFLDVQASEQEIKLLCFSGDADKDGKIDFSEFVNNFVHFSFEPVADERAQQQLTGNEIRLALAGDAIDARCVLPSSPYL